MRSQIDSALKGFARRSLYRPVEEQVLRDVEAQLTKAIPQDYKWFLSNVSNGADLGGLTLLPVMHATFDRKEIKRCWDSIQRNNDPAHAPWFHRDPATFDAFFVFAAVPGACFAMKYDPADTSIWLWNAGDGEVEQLDYAFGEWLSVTGPHTV